MGGEGWKGKEKKSKADFPLKAELDVETDPTTTRS